MVRKTADASRSNDGPPYRMGSRCPDPLSLNPPTKGIRHRPHKLPGVTKPGADTGPSLPSRGRDNPSLEGRIPWLPVLDVQPPVVAQPGADAGPSLPSGGRGNPFLGCRIPWLPFLDVQPHGSSAVPRTTTAETPCLLRAPLRFSPAG